LQRLAGSDAVEQAFHRIPHQGHFGREQAAVMKDRFERQADVQFEDIRLEEGDAVGAVEGGDGIELAAEVGIEVNHPVPEGCEGSREVL